MEETLANMLKSRSCDQEELYVQEILQFAPFAVFKADAVGNVLFINKEWENISGMSPTDALGKGWLAALVKEDVPIILNLIEEAAAQQKQALFLQYRIQHPDKGVRHCNIDIRLVQDEYGKGRYFIGYVQDVTEEYVARENFAKAEKRQYELNAFLESLIASIDDIVFEIDGDKRFRNVWVKDEKTLFVPKAAIIGQTIQEVLGPFSALLAGPIDEAILHRETREFQYRHIDPGVDRWYTAKVTPIREDTQNENYRLALIIHDKTDEIKQAHTLKATKDLLERTNHILESSQRLSNTGGWEFDIESGKIFWTRQMYAIYGVPLDYDPSTPASNLAFYLKKHKNKVMRALQRVFHEQRPHVVDAEIESGDRQLKWIRLYGSPSVVNGKVVAMHGALMDITQQKLDAKALVEAKNSAEEAARSKTDFLSVMSHEIRTPLNGIIGIANLLKLSNLNNQETYIDNLIFSSDYLLQLINDILDLTKIDSNNVELMRQEINLFELLANITDQFSSFAKAKSIDFTCTIDPRIPERIVGDATRLSQILYNLISNALKYTDEGKVTVTAKEIARDQLQTTILFSIQDTGIGIPKEYHDAVFDSFKQVQQRNYRKYASTGLGLAITKKLIELHNSHISMNSTPNEGTTFQFELTFELGDQYIPSKQTADRASVTAYENKLGWLHVLLVEDNPINAMVAQKQLGYFGITPHHASNGKEALELLEKNSYHIAFVDLHMPEMDGHTLANTIDQHYPDVHIIISTADIMRTTPLKLADIKAYDILSKPIVMEKMLILLLKVAGEKGAY